MSNTEATTTTQKPILYYVPGSPPSRTVLLVARALNLELDAKIVALERAEHLEPWFVALNPQHTVPTLVDTDGRALWDSHAISTYLIGKYGGSRDHPLYPADLYTRARIDQRLQFDTAHLFTVAREIFVSIYLHGGCGPSAEQVARVHEAYAWLEQFLTADPWAVGAGVTVADLALVTSVTQIALLVPVEAERWPHVVGWLRRLDDELPYIKELNTDLLAVFGRLIEGLLVKNRAAAAEAAK